MINFQDFEFEKGGKPAVLGEQRMFGGRMHVKTINGWRYYGKGDGTKARSHVEELHKKQPTTVDLNRPIYNREEVMIGDRIDIKKHTKFNSSHLNSDNQDGYEVVDVKGATITVSTPNGEMTFNRRSGLLQGDKQGLSKNNYTMFHVREQNTPKSTRIVKPIPPKNEAVEKKITAEDETHSNEMGSKAHSEGKYSNPEEDPAFVQKTKGMSEENKTKLATKWLEGFNVQKYMEDKQSKEPKQDSKTDESTSIKIEDLEKVKLPGGRSSLDLYDLLIEAFEDPYTEDDMKAFGLEIPKYTKRLYKLSQRQDPDNEDSSGILGLREFAMNFSKNNPGIASKIIQQFL